MSSMELVLSVVGKSLGLEVPEGAASAVTSHALISPFPPTFSFALPIHLGQGMSMSATPMPLQHNSHTIWLRSFPPSESRTISSWNIDA